MSNSIVFKNVTKKYKMYDNPKEKLKGLFHPEKYGEDFYALQNVSFTAAQGDVIGIIGVNGAGKSTMSNLISGISPPTSGSMKIKGESALIAINSGLNGQLTGMENIELKLLMLGFNKKEIKALVPDIIEFADIGKFINQPVKSYSSGMKSRLGFAISVNINPDVLVIDEALSVGDQTFTNKCLDKMEEFKNKGKTIFFISHSISQVKRFCDKALWLEGGMVREYGLIEEIMPKYEAFLKAYKAWSKEEKKKFQAFLVHRRSNPIETHISEEDTITDSVINKTLQPRADKQRKHRTKKRMKKIVYSILVLIVIGIGTFLGYQNLFKENAISNAKNLSSQKEAHKDSSDAQEEKLKLKFISVDQAFIRAEPNLESQASEIAGLGWSYHTDETYYDQQNDVEWLHVSRPGIKGKGGWVSNKLVTTLKDQDKVVDESFISSLENALGMPLSDRISALGKQESDLPSGSQSEYEVVEDRLTFYNVDLSNSLLTDGDLQEQLGKPQIKNKYSLFYHGAEYDYLITLGQDNVVKSLVITYWKPFLEF